MSQLIDLNRTRGFRKSVTMKPELAAIEKLLSSQENVLAHLCGKVETDRYPGLCCGGQARAATGRDRRAAGSAREKAELEHLKEKVWCQR